MQIKLSEMENLEIENSKMDSFVININSLIKDAERGEEIDIESFKNSMKEISVIDLPYAKYLMKSSMDFLEYIDFLKKETCNKKTIICSITYGKWKTLNNQDHFSI